MVLSSLHHVKNLTLLSPFHKVGTATVQIILEISNLFWSYHRHWSLLIVQNYKLLKFSNYVFLKIMLIGNRVGYRVNSVAA